MSLFLTKPIKERLNEKL